MSLANEFFVLFGKNVTRDAQGLNARLHFFGSIPVEDGSPVSSTREDVPSMNVRAARPTVVALVSVNGGVGRSTLATALSSGLQRQGESVVALDLDPQNALRHHFGVSPDAEGLGPASLQNAQWAAIQ
ncbi:cellulose synthase operon protein YhjQ/BcsQ, partial [Pseudomonas sp. R81]